ncbi:MAG: Crp/Fnr family transcriptional regulator [Chloroflexota bacterium]|nr:Crp/Fnr family transcriptional regulator [Chloroflexota bacterium]
MACRNRRQSNRQQRTAGLYCVTMSDRLDLDLLRRSLMLHSLPQAELERVAAMMRPRRYRRGAPVCHLDDPGEELHLVVRGRLKVVVPGETGEEAVLTIVGPGDLFGEMSLLDGGPRSATVIPLEPVETYALRRHDFLQLLRSNPDAVESVLRALAQTIRRLSDQVTALMFLDLRGRLAKKLLELAAKHGRDAPGGVELEIELTQEDLAGMVGATRPRVNNALGFFEDRGAIARRGRRLVIRDAGLLQHWVVE